MWMPEREYLTIQQTAMILGVSDDFVRQTVAWLLEQGVLAGVTDVLEIPPRPSARRTVRKQYRQFRIHKETGLGKIKAHLKPRDPKT